MGVEPGSAEFEQDMSGWQDRANRLTTLLMVGRIMTASGDHLCRIRNISPGGMLVECNVALAIDEAVKIELRNLNVVTARVRWVEAGRIGIQFDAPVEVANLLQQPEGSQFRPRAPRLGATCPVLVWTNGFNRRATLVDVSQTGCRLEVSGAMTVGEEVRITIPGLPPRHAVLRWARMGVGGFSFNESLSFADLMSWNKTRVV